jgi:hypothetical protein
VFLSKIKIFCHPIVSLPACVPISRTHGACMCTCLVQLTRLASQGVFDFLALAGLDSGPGPGQPRPGYHCTRSIVWFPCISQAWSNQFCVWFASRSLAQPSTTKRRCCLISAWPNHQPRWEQQILIAEIHRFNTDFNNENRSQLTNLMQWFMDCITSGCA